MNKKVEKLIFALRPTLVSTSIFMITMTLLGTAIPAYYSQKKSIGVIWSDLAKEISEKTTGRILRYFMVAPPLASMLEGLVDRGEISFEKPMQIFDACYEGLSANKDLTALFFVRPNGDFIGIIENFEKQRYLASHRFVNPDGVTTEKNYTLAADKSWIPIDVAKSNYDPRKRPYWNSAVMQPQGGWSKPYPFLNTTETGFSYTLAQETKDVLYGYWVLNFQINFVTDYLKDLNPGKNGIVFIVDRDGSLISSSLGKHMEGKDLVEKAWDTYSRSYRKTGGFTIGDHIFYADQFPEWSGIPWTVITMIHENDFLLPIKERMYQSMLVGTLLCAFFALLASIFFGRVSHRLKEISEEMDEIGELGFELGENLERHSFIKEINTMNISLHKMKVALLSFTKYLPLQLVRSLTKSGHLAELGGEKKEISVLFADLTNFTQITEKMPPDQLAQVLDAHLTFMTNQIVKQGGVVDKYIGDAVMAMMGAPNELPNHALAACKAALGIKSDETSNTAIRHRIGINTGMVIVGNFGSKDRMDYTAIGDSVNLASRLESLNRFYGTEVLIGEVTAKQVEPYMVLRPLDYVTVKGKTQSILVHELIGEKFSVPHKKQPAIDKYAAALAAYRSRKFSEAASLFDEALQLFDGFDTPSSLMAKRCRSYAETPPPANWDGSRVMDEK